MLTIDKTKGTTTHCQPYDAYYRPPDDSRPCPGCGRCPTCGRSSNWDLPVLPYYLPRSLPNDWDQPFHATTTGGSSETDTTKEENQND